MPSGLQADGRYFCKPCRLEFPDWNGYLSHLKVFRDKKDPKHICCTHCGQAFKTEKAQYNHVHQFHPAPQNLFCPGCGQGPFIRMAGLMSHVEFGKCPKISMDTINRKREEKTKFVRELEVLARQHVRGNFSDCIKPSNAGHFVGSAWESGPASAKSTLTAGGRQKTEHKKFDGGLGAGHDAQPASGLGELDGVMERNHDKDASVSRRDANSSGPSGSSSHGYPELVSLKDLSLGHRKTGTRLPGSGGVTDWVIPAAKQSRAGTETPHLLGGAKIRDWVLGGNSQDTERRTTSSQILADNKVRKWISNLAMEGNARAVAPKSAGNDAVVDWAVDRGTFSHLLQDSGKPGIAQEAKSDSVIQTVNLGLPGSGATDWPAEGDASSDVCLPTTTTALADDAGGIAARDNSPDLKSTEPESPAEEAKATTTGGVWSTDPNVASTRWPTAEEMDAMPQNDEAPFDASHPHHPGNASFCVNRYRNDFGQFKCPMIGCQKVFKVAKALVGHLRGPYHGDQKFTCPRCYKVFKSLTAVTSHVEAPNSRCVSRNCDDYNTYLDQLTSGLVNVDGAKNADGTNKYVTPDTAWSYYGGSEKAKRPARGDDFARRGDAVCEDE